MSRIFYESRCAREYLVESAQSANLYLVTCGNDKNKIHNFKSQVKPSFTKFEV